MWIRSLINEGCPIQRVEPAEVLRINMGCKEMMMETKTRGNIPSRLSRKVSSKSPYKDVFQSARNEGFMDPVCSPSTPSPRPRDVLGEFVSVILFRKATESNGCLLFEGLGPGWPDDFAKEVLVILCGPKYLGVT